jgi:hypothetical protein
MGIEVRKLLRYSIVFAHPQGMHRQQAKLFVGSEVARKEAWYWTVTWLEAVNGRVAIERKKGLAVFIDAWTSLEQPSAA